MKKTMIGESHGYETYIGRSSSIVSKKPYAGTTYLIEKNKVEGEISNYLSGIELKAKISIDW